MEVRSDRPSEPAALEPRAAVVAESVHDPTEGLCAVIQNGLPCVVLEAGDLERSTRLERHSSRTSPIMRTSPATVSCANSPAPGMNDPSRPR